jgi:hypothetical protein
MSAAGTLCPCRAWNAACPFMKGTADQEEPTGRVLDFVCR